MTFRVLIIGGTGQVGAAVVRALAAEPFCAEIVMVNRRTISATADPCVRQVVLDTAAAQFPAEVSKLAQGMVAQGDPVYGASCVGVGQGSMKWSEEELKALEIGVVGGFARGCRAGGITRFALLSAVGSTAKSRIRYVRVMGLKEEMVQGTGFQRLAVFRPGIIAGNVHTPRYVADDLLTLKFAVVEGTGASVLPDYMCRREINAGKLVEVLPGWGPAPGICHAVFPARRALVPAVRRLIDFLVENLDGAEPHHLAE